MFRHSVLCLGVSDVKIVVVVAVGVVSVVGARSFAERLSHIHVGLES